MMELVGIKSYLIISVFMFSAGLFTTVSRQNIIGIFMGIELILNAAALNFAAFSRFSAISLEGQIFSLFIIVLAATEAAIALALLLSIYRRYKEINAENLDKLRF